MEAPGQTGRGLEAGGERDIGREVVDAIQLPSTLRFFSPFLSQCAWHIQPQPASSPPLHCPPTHRLPSPPTCTVGRHGARSTGTCRPHWPRGVRRGRGEGVSALHPPCGRSAGGEGIELKCSEWFHQFMDSEFKTLVSLGLYLVVGVVSSSSCRLPTIGRQVGGARSKFKSGQVEKWLVNCKVSLCCVSTVTGAHLR